MAVRKKIAKRSPKRTKPYPPVEMITRWEWDRQKVDYCVVYVKVSTPFYAVPIAMATDDGNYNTTEVGISIQKGRDNGDGGTAWGDAYTQRHWNESSISGLCTPEFTAGFYKIIVDQKVKVGRPIFTSVGIFPPDSIRKNKTKRKVASRTVDGVRAGTS